MRYSTQVKPISYLKSNAAEVLRDLTERREPMGSPRTARRAVIQDGVSYEETQETLALLKVLALSKRDETEGRISPLPEVVKRLRAGELPER